MWRCELIKNKIYSVLLMLIGIIPILIGKDSTFLVFALIIGIPLFCAKKNWII